VTPQKALDPLTGRPKLYRQTDRIHTGEAAAGPQPVINFAPQLNVGMFAGMPTEYREMAERLWVEFQRIAMSNGIKLQSIGARTQ